MMSTSIYEYIVPVLYKSNFRYIALQFSQTILAKFKVSKRLMKIHKEHDPDSDPGPVFSRGGIRIRSKIIRICNTYFKGYVILMIKTLSPTLSNSPRGVMFGVKMKFFIF
jgi:hypothetical protein